MKLDFPTPLFPMMSIFLVLESDRFLVVEEEMKINGELIFSDRFLAVAISVLLFQSSSSKKSFYNRRYFLYIFINSLGKQSI